MIGCLQLLLRCLAALCHSFNSHQITLIFLVERTFERVATPNNSITAPHSQPSGPRNNWPRPLQLETQQQTTRASSVLVSFRCVCCSVNVNPTAPADAPHLSRYSNNVFIACTASSCCDGRGRTRQHRLPTRRAAWVACLLDDLDCRRRRLIPYPATASCAHF